MQNLKVIRPPEKDLGGFSVRRALPTTACRNISYFVFFDHMGPAEMSRERGLNVRPHPHINLATVTYLFDGSIIHRDSLGTKQLIEAGDVNWMTAGRGIVHSERTPHEGPENLKIHGIQIWVALPKEKEEIAPSFFHHAKSSLPTFTKDDAELRLILGEIFGHISPVQIDSEIFYLDARLNSKKNLSLELPSGIESGIYVIDGEIEIFNDKAESEFISKSTLVVFEPNHKFKITAKSDSHFVLLGGAPLPEPRHMWWNFISTSKERIEKAKQDWIAQTMGRIPGETEYIPLPET